MKIPPRFQAFGLHLSGSLLIALGAAAPVFLFWYPWPLGIATGVKSIFLLLLGVHVIIGPCITLLIFNRTKKELKLDLAIVLILQLSALAYGMHAVFSARPVYLVFSIDHFELVYANDFNEEKLASASDERFKSLPVLAPEYIGARLPENVDRRNLVQFSQLLYQLPLQPQYYLPYVDLLKPVQDSLQPLKQLAVFNAAQAHEVDELLGKYASSYDDTGFLPLLGADEELSVIVRKNDGAPLEIRRLKPRL